MIQNMESFWETLDSGYIDVDNMSTEELDESFEFLNGKMSIIYHFVLTYNEYINTRHSYTNDEEGALTTLEAHLLTDICDTTDATVTSLANAWNRSVSATSQTVRKLIQKKLVTRKNSKKDGKIFYLSPTKQGLHISYEHKKYDTLDIIKTMKTLRHSLSKVEIETIFSSLKAYTELLQGKGSR